MKKYILSVVISLVCISCYLLAKEFEKAKIVERDIVYTSDTASEVVMVWGINYLQLPSEEFWPQGSYMQDSLVYTKLTIIDGEFRTKLRLPHNTILNYWMVQLQDKQGNRTDIWDTGGADKEYFLLTFADDGLFRPGYFIFLAGFLPLLLFYLTDRKKKTAAIVNNHFNLKEYVPQFDSIRAIAVLFVVIYHWVPEKSSLGIILKGPNSVDAFFVLSGFLITAILMKLKVQVEEQTLRTTTAVIGFYVRRSLRIFPVYYLVIAILFLMQDQSVKGYGIYYTTYLTNFLFYSEQFFPAHVAHLWSLAVEEQFYLFWPWIILLLSRRHLPYVIALFLVIGISSNYIFSSYGWWVTIFTSSCFDAFAIGAALSYLVVYRQDIIEMIQPKYPIIFSLAILLFLLNANGYSFLPTRTIHSLLAALGLYYCLFKNNNKVVNAILTNKWLIRIGKISYGMYVYHIFVPEIWLWILGKANAFNIDLFYNNSVPHNIKPYWLFMQQFLFLLLLCTISYMFYEQPINNLKNKFGNKPRRKNPYLVEEKQLNVAPVGNT